MEKIVKVDGIRYLVPEVEEIKLTGDPEMLISGEISFEPGRKMEGVEGKPGEVARESHPPSR